MTVLLFAVAAISPLAVGRLVTGSQVTGEEDLLTCLFIPTTADWPSHLVSYTLAGVLFASILAGLYSFLKQWYQTHRTVKALLMFACRSSDKLWLRRDIPADLRGRIDLITLDKPVAFCYGWIRPRICLSTGAISGLSAQEIEALLLHEYHHAIRHDPLRTAVSRMLALSFFFLPVVRVLHMQYMVAKEIEADDYARRTQGTYRPLIGALYKLLLRQADPGQSSSLAVTGAIDAINQRLDYLLDKRVPPGPCFATVFISACMIAAATAGLALTTRAAVSSVLWYQAHVALGGC